MPAPLRRVDGLTPSVPSSAPTSVPATPAPSYVSRDGFSRTGGATGIRTTPLAPPHSSTPAQPVAELAGVDDRKVALYGSGALHVATDRGVDPQVEAAAVLALAQTDAPKNPFEAINDARLLDAVIRQHLRLYSEVLGGGRLASETPYTQRHARAALLAVARLATLRLVQLAPAEAESRGLTLVRAAERDTHQALRRFEVYRSLASPELGATRALQQATSIVFPSTPPYEAWAKDGVLRVKAYVDDDGATWQSQVDIFKHKMGMRVVAGDENDKTKQATFRGTAPRGSPFRSIEVILAPAPKKDAPPSLFEDIAKPEIDIILYSGHAGYGQRVDAALRAGVQTSGAGKLIMLFQCWGAGNLDSIGRAFPEAQLFSTIDSSTAWTDDPTTALTLRSFLQKKSWGQIIGDLQHYKAKTPKNGWDQLYFTPGTRQIIEEHSDLDRDGQAMRNDLVYNEPASELLRRSATSWNAVAHPVPLYSLDATAAGNAVDDASLVLRYSQFGLQAIPPGERAALELKPELLESGGVFKPTDGDLSAFKFEVVTVGTEKRLRVRVSAAFAHAREEDLKNLLAFELGKQLAAWSGKDAAESIAYGMAFYLQSVFQHKSQWESAAALTHEPAEHALFLARYGMPALPFDELLHGAGPGDHPAFTAANLDPFIRKMVGWIGRHDAAPRQVGRALTIANATSLLDDARWGARLDVGKVERFVHGLGYAGATVISISPDDSWSDEPRAVHVRQANGSRSVIVLDVDRQSGKALAAYDLGASLDLQEIALADIAAQHERWSATMFTGNDRARDAQAVLQTVSAALRGGKTPKEARDAAKLAITQRGGDATKADDIFSGSRELLRDAFGATATDDLFGGNASGNWS